MGSPRKPIDKNANIRSFARNNKQEIFTRLSKASQSRTTTKIQTIDIRIEDPHQKD